MKSLKCLGFTVLYTFASIGCATFKTDAYSDVVRILAVCGEGFCFGMALSQAFCCLVYLLAPDFGESTLGTQLGDELKSCKCGSK